MITFKKSTSLEYIANSDIYSETMLTQFFIMNQTNETTIKKNLLYREFPEHFVWIYEENGLKGKRGK